MNIYKELESDLGINIAQHGFSATERMSNVKIIGCHAENANVCFLVQLANTFRNQRAEIIGCSAFGGLYGFYLTQSDYADVVGCVAIGMTSHGFLISDASYSSFSNCKSLGNGGDGFSVIASSLGASQENNFTACHANTNTGRGFFSDANSTYQAYSLNSARGNTGIAYNTLNATTIAANNR